MPIQMSKKEEWRRRLGLKQPEVPLEDIPAIEPVTSPWISPKTPLWQPQEEAPEITLEGLPEVTPTALPEVAPTPFYKQAIGKVGEAFEWVQEELERPWGAIVTAPWSPALEARPGESWLERQKREYKAWEAPKFVKGVAEFSLPLWWLPYFGWMAKGAGLIPRIGGTIAKGIVSAERTLALPITVPLRLVAKGAFKAIELPAMKVMRERVFTADRWGILAKQLSKVPGVRGAIGTINPSAVADGLAQEARILHGGLREMGRNAVNAEMPYLTSIATNAKALFGVDDLTRCTGIVHKETGLHPLLGDLMQTPTAYRAIGATRLTGTQSKYISRSWEMLDNWYEYATKMGVEIPRKEFDDVFTHYFPHIYEGKVGVLDVQTGILRPVGTMAEPDKWVELPLKYLTKIGVKPTMPETRRIGVKAGFTRPRFYDLVEEAATKGWIPKGDPNEIMAIYGAGIYDMVVDKMVAASLKPLGKTIKELTPRIVRENVAEAVTYARALKHTESALQRAIRGERLPASTIKMIRRVLPNVADRLEGKVAPKMGIVGARPAQYNIAVIDREIVRIQDILKTPGRLPKEVGTKAQARLELARLEARKTISEIAGEVIENPEMLDELIRSALSSIETELGTRGLPYRAGAISMFPEFTSRQLDSMRTVYTDFLGALGKGEVRIGEAIPALAMPTSQELRTLVKGIKQLHPLAKASYWTAVGIRKQAYEAARKLPGWRAVGQPFAAGRLFPNAVADDLTKMMTDRAMPLITKASDINALSRFLITGFDFGAGLIQGVPLLMTNPVRWGKAMGLSVEAFFKPGVREAYLRQPKNLAILEQLIPEGLLIGNSEFMEATGRGILRSNPVQTIDKLNVIQRFATSFNTFGDIARIEWAKALTPLVVKEGKSLAELTSFLNKATGVMSSQALGVGASQRQLESAVLFFAPRYFRANMALWGDMMRGGLRGQLARDTLASMTMGGFFWYYGLCKALGQEPNFDPSTGKFMTVEIGYQHIGLGSMQVAMMRLLGNISKTALENPEDFIKLDSRDNPLVRFSRSRVAPITGALWDVVTGKTFIGEPIDDPIDFGVEVVAPRVLPFWMASFVSDYPRPGLAGPPAEIFGARTWPLQLWERRDELGERLAMADFGKPWRSTKTEMGITRLERAKLEEKYPELKDLTEQIQIQRVERAGAKEEAWVSFSAERDTAKAVQGERFTAIQSKFDMREISGYEARQLIQQANAELRSKYRHIESNPAYGEVIEYFAQPMTEDEMRDTPLEDIAFDTYMELMYSGDLEEPTGEYKYDERDRREDIFVAQWGEGMLQYVKELLAAGKDVPPIVQEYYRAVEVMKPFWEFKDLYIGRFGLPRTASQQSAMNSLVANQRARLVVTNREVGYYYGLFYRQQPEWQRGNWISRTPLPWATQRAWSTPGLKNR